MKSNSRLMHYILLIAIIGLFMHSQNSLGQDLIRTKTGDEIKVKILSKSRRYITFYSLGDPEKKVLELHRKHIKWYRPDFWTKKRFSFLFSFGSIPYGTSTDLKNYMKKNNFDDTNYPLLPLLPFPIFEEYPKSQVKIPWIFEMEYLFKSPNGISFSLSRINNGSVTGYNGSLKLNPEISYNNTQFSISYKHYSKSYRSSLKSGIILNFNTISWKINSWGKQPGGSNTDPLHVLPGILIGYSGSLIEKNIYFLRFQTQFSYIPSVKISSNYRLLDEEKISQSSLFLGIETGFKIHSKQND